MQQQAVSASQGKGGALGLPLPPPFAQQPLSALLSCSRTAHHVSIFMSYTKHYIQLQPGHSGYCVPMTGCW